MAVTHFNKPSKSNGALYGRLSEEIFNARHQNGGKVPTFNEADLQRMEGLVNNLFSCRTDFFRQFFQTHKDIDNECGWPTTLEPQFFRSLYDRNAIAERVIEVYPKECWQLSPEVYEDEKSKNVTKFERAWDELGANLFINGKSWLQDEKGSLIWSYLERLDIQSRIGTYGVLLLGLDDGRLLEEPAAGAPPDGAPKDISGVSGLVSSDLTAKDIYGGQLPKALEQPLASTMGTDAQYFGVQFTPMRPPEKKKDGANLLFLRVFDESLVQVVQYEASMYSPRFGCPIMYRITLNDPRQPHTGIGLPLATVRVHWSRVVHVADNLQSSEIFGAPALRAVVNNVLDLRKLYGGSAEMYWRGAFPGLSIESQPQMAGDVVWNEQRLAQMMQDYHTGLQRWIALTGLNAKSLAPQVVDPSPQILVQLQAICIKLGCPLRVFMGSERGELASSQDDAAWNDRLLHRQQFHLTPRIIAPFVDRLILLGVLPEPEGYSIEWPDLDSTTKKDKAAIALQRTQAIGAYVQTGVEQVIPPQEYLTKIMEFDEEEAEAILAEAEAAQEDKEDEAQALADEHGFEPAPPPGFSKPPPPPPPGTTPPGGQGGGRTPPGGAPKTPKGQLQSDKQKQRVSEQNPQQAAPPVTHTANLSYGEGDELEAADDGRRAAAKRTAKERKRYTKLVDDLDDDYRPRHVAPIDVERKQKDGEIPYGTSDVADPLRPTVVRPPKKKSRGSSEAPALNELADVLEALELAAVTYLEHDA